MGYRGAAVPCMQKILDLRGNGTPLLIMDVLPFEINNENYFLFIGFICTKFSYFPCSSVISWVTTNQRFGLGIRFFASSTE